MMFRKIFFGAALVIFLAYHPGSAPAVTVSWDFTDGLDHSNLSYASNSNVTLTDTAGELQLTKPAVWSGPAMVQWGSIYSNFLLHGNFDVQVDYKINTTSLNYGVQIQFNLENNPYFSLVYGNDMPPGQNYHIYTPGTSWPATLVKSDNQGTLRVSRSGGTATFYFADAGQPSGWNALYSDSGFGSQDIHFDLVFQDNQYVTGTAASFDGSFDNLRVTADALSGYQPVPLPPSVLLLGAGLLGVAGWRHWSQKG